MKNYIQYPRVGGTASRQAHADLPPGTYEREMGKEGFFGPASFFYHRHPPTGWSHFEGPLRPHAYDLLKLGHQAESPWDAPLVLGNAHTQLRYWETAGNMSQLARNADGDQLLFVHRGSGDLYCDFGRLVYASGDYIVLNNKDKSLSNPGVRKAITLAINRQAICDSIFEGTRKPATNIVPPGVVGYEDGIWADAKYDVAGAKQALRNRVR